MGTMSEDQAQADKTKKTRRLVWAPGPPDEPLVRSMYEAREDSKGWDRVSIAAKTHPLHPFPKITAKDLRAPSASNRLRLIGDSLLFGVAVAIFVFFPLLMADLLAGGAYADWVWGTMLGAGVIGAVAIFLWASASEPDMEDIEARLF
jgi:hypothetical protein